MEAPENATNLFPEFPPITLSEWEAQIIADLKGADYEKKLIWKTYDGLSLKPYYRREDLKDLTFTGSVPGLFPFVRGNKQTRNNWEIRQDIYAEDPAAANLVAREAIRQGAEGVGFYIARTREVEEMRALLDEIDLSKTAVHFLNARHYPTLLDLFINYLDINGHDHKQIHGSLNYDPLGYALVHGDFYRGKDKDFEEAPLMIKKVREELQEFRVININGQHFHQAGATVIQEMAYTLASGNEYLADLTDRGLKIEEITPHMQFTLSIGSDYFIEIAKIRAIRMLWARIVEQYQPADTSYCKMHIHSTSSQWNKTLYDPYTNLLRTTTEAMSAAIGGAEIISLSPFDINYKNADEFSYHIARNQQIILKEESWLDKVADPSAGSYYLEVLTDQLAAAAWDLFKETEAKGGLIACMEKGLIQDALASSASIKEDDLATRKLVSLGTNQYPNQAEGMRSLITKSAKAPKVHAETAFKPIRLFHATHAFDELRLRTEDFIANGGKKPVVLLFNFGNLAMQKARAAFATNFFACAGFEIIDNPAFATIAEGIEYTVQVQPDIVVFCSSDDEYAELAKEACTAIKVNSQNSIMVLAGYPKEQLESLTKLGIEEFIHVRSNILKTLTHFQNKLGIR